MPDIDADFSWLVRGSQRRLLFSKLKQEFLPNKLRKEINEDLPKALSLREVSRHIRNFAKRGLVACMSRNSPYNKIYILTEKGKKLQARLLKSRL